MDGDILLYYGNISDYVGLSAYLADVNNFINLLREKYGI